MKKVVKEIAWSAKEIGEWNSFTFNGNEKIIYIGNTWKPGEKVKMYRANGAWPRGNSPLEGYFYLSSPKNPKFNKFGPNYTNLHVSFSD